MHWIHYFAVLELYSNANKLGSIAIITVSELENLRCFRKKISMGISQWDQLDEKFTSPNGKCQIICGFLCPSKLSKTFLPTVIMLHISILDHHLK